MECAAEPAVSALSAVLGTRCSPVIGMHLLPPCVGTAVCNLYM